MQHRGPQQHPTLTIASKADASEIERALSRKVALLLQVISILDRQRRELLVENQALREAR
jgi:hypothetical protein